MPEVPSAAAAFFAAVRRGFIAYARWLDGIKWTRFFLLAVLAMIVSGIVSDLPPFSWKWGEDRVVYDEPEPHGNAPAAPAPASAASVALPPAPPSPEKTAKDRHKQRYDISINKDGVHITSIPEPAASAPASKPQASDAQPGVRVDVSLPPSASTDEIRVAIEDAKDAIREAIEQAAADEAKADEEAAAAAQDRGHRRVIPAFRPGDHLPGFTMFIIVMSLVIKIMAAGRFKAEAQAVEATEMAESEALKRQVIEARMAAMQAQVEPHFLFNTLASIDHLIETDAARASKMQKNLIALLRAAMPTMREANAQGTRDLGRELAVIQPYLEILKVRMEERLQTEIDVPDGLLSADFPPMMLQSLVENAIKHGLEPKAEGGKLSVKAQIVHGKLQVTVADTGLGFGRASTGGTGIGLNNIRERLQLLYGRKASLVISEPPGGGTAVSITVPYTTSQHEGVDA